MNKEEKDILYRNILDKYVSQRAQSFENDFDTVLNGLFDKDPRTIVIVGSAFLEELCKSCFLSTMTELGRIKFIDDHSRELTFSLTSNMLFSQDYLSKEIFDLINSLRRIRNHYAHSPIIKEKQMNSIDELTENVRKIIDNRWVTRYQESISQNKSLAAQLYLVVFENLMVGLISLHIWTNPNQKLAKLQFVKNQKSIKLAINVSVFNEYTEGYFREKYKCV